ncbi:hypothetical protein Pmani_002655 [Petrolisthes manimaculis]|uniref:RYamide n=1 Tax=Petrolisthes manimaculis TaxID=1843537 RepID=A0AAE1UQ86_9EUCA|nr:hypothetical protein Pmani_002655 [Petrolisthes manimaculis]
MSRLLCPTLVLLAALLALAASQGFYPQRYGKRPDARQLTLRSGFYANRYGRSSPLPQGLPEVKVRSSRFVGGSRYGKRSSNPDTNIQATLANSAEGEDTDLPTTLVVGDSVVCLMVEVPDIYRCLRSVFVQWD